MPSANRNNVAHFPDRRYAKIPYTFTDKVCEYILAEMANGRTLTSICKEPGMPSAGSVAAWALKDPVFARKFIFARRRRALVYSEEIIDIADNEDGGVDDKVKISRSTARIKTRQWLIEHDLPELFGAFAERKDRPLAVIDERGREVLELNSNDPIEAAKEYAKIMSAHAIAENRVVDVMEPDVDADEMDVNVPGDLNVDHEFSLNKMRGDLADNDPVAVPRPATPTAMTDHYDNDRPKRNDDFDRDVYVEPDGF